MEGSTNIFLVAAIVVAVLLMCTTGDCEETKSESKIEMKPEPMEGMEDRSGLYIEGESIGHVMTNTTQGGWSASNSHQAYHDLNSREEAMAVLIKDHYQA